MASAEFTSLLGLHKPIAISHAFDGFWRLILDGWNCLSELRMIDGLVALLETRRSLETGAKLFLERLILPHRLVEVIDGLVHTRTNAIRVHVLVLPVLEPRVGHAALWLGLFDGVDG